MRAVHLVVWARDLDDSYLQVEVLVSDDAIDLRWRSAGAFAQQDLVFMNLLATKSSLSPKMCDSMSITYTTFNS